LFLKSVELIQTKTCGVIQGDIK